MTKKELEQVYYLKQELIMWQDRRKKIQASISVSRKAYDGMPHSKTNKTSSQTESKAIKLFEVNKRIQDKANEIQVAIAEIEDYILSVDDSLNRQIIEYRCCQLKTWEEIAGIIGNGYTADAVRQTYHRFTKKLPKG